MNVRRISLKNGLPLVVLLVLVGLLLLSYFDTVARGHDAVLERASQDAKLLAENLARSAQRDLQDRPALVAADLAMAATDRRVSSLALVSPEGNVVVAHRLAWENHPAAQVIPGFSVTRFKRVTQVRLSDLDISPDRQRLTVMLPYFRDQDDQALRDMNRGVVYLEYELWYEYALTDDEALHRLVPQLVVALLLMLGLGTLMRTRVTRPLERLEAASLEFSAKGDVAHPVPESGTREVQQLAHSFNTMTSTLRQARRELESHQARLAGVVDSAMDAIITVQVVDGRYTIGMVNAAAGQMFGLADARELIGQPVEALIPESIQAEHAIKMRQLSLSGGGGPAVGRRAMVRGRRMDGQEFPAEASISRLQLNGEELFTVIMRDVTERVNAEAEIRKLNVHLESLVAQRTASLEETKAQLEAEQARLRSSSRELAALFDATYVGIVLTHRRKVLRCNRHFETLLGWGPGELIGQSTRIWYEDDATFQSVGKDVYASMLGGVLTRREVMLVRKDGSRFWARMSGQRFATEQNDDALLVVFEDVSDEHRVAEVLQQAKEQAEQANRAKSSFLANMSHEIRTPMNAIIGMTYLALKTRLDAKQTDYLQKIQQSSVHLLGIINDILDFSKIEADKMSIEHIDFQLTAVLDNFVNLISAKAQAKGLELIFDVGHDVPEQLIGDPLRLGQVLINYGNNAVKFTPKGEIRLQVRTLQATDREVLLRFDVIDTGIGLSQDQQQRLFQSFHQADSSTSRQFGGTGLGLAIVRRLTALMGGETGVNSEPGQGSDFWFTARFGIGQVEASNRAHGPVRLDGVRALVVDDNDSARAVLVDLARGLGMTVDAVSSGAAALESLKQANLQQQGYQIMLLDWQMPELDGLETGRRIQALTLHTQPHLILVTGHGREEVFQQARQSGFAAVLIKPLNASVLLDNLMPLLCDNVLETGVAPAPASPPPATETLNQLRGTRVLVVDDNEINQQIASELLRDAGLVVDLCSNGELAVQAVQSQVYGLVLMDMQMPVLDGPAATRQIRALPGLAELPIVAMTANVLPADRRICLDSGMNDLLPKPLAPERLFDMVATWAVPTGAPVWPVPSAQAQPADTQRDEKEALEALGRITGLEVSAGLMRSGGKTRLYLSLLRQFSDSLEPTALSIRRACQAKDRLAAGHQAHALKGVAGNLGAVALQHMAQRLETALKTPDDSAQVLAEELASAALALKAMLVSCLPPPPPQQPPAADHDAGDPTQFAEACQVMERQLAQGDAAALETLEQHANGWPVVLGPGHAEFVRQVRQFDFESARTALLAAMASHGAPPPSLCSTT